MKRLSFDTILFTSMFTCSDKFMVALLGLHFPPMQSVSSTNVDEDDAACVALRLRLVMAAIGEQYAHEQIVQI